MEAAFVITLFLPLSMLGVWFGAWLTRGFAHSARGSSLIALGALPVALSFMVACGAAGALVGRFGGRAKAREAALSGGLGAFLGWGLAALGGNLRPWLVAFAALLILVVFGAISASIGARLSQSRRI